MSYAKNPNFEKDLGRWAESCLQKWNPRSRSFRCPSPDHEDKNPSCTLSESGWITCHSCGLCGWSDEVAKQCGLPVPPQKSISPTKTKECKKKGSCPDAASISCPRTKATLPVIATHIYLDTEGRPLYKIKRFQYRDLKEFRAHAFDGAQQKYGRDMSGAEPCLYGLERLSQLPDGSMVIFGEGEKVAESIWLLGLSATTTPFGALATAKTKDFSALENKDIVLCPDNDRAGEKWLADLVPRLAPIAQRVRVLRLPDLKEGGDLADFVAGGGDRTKLLRLIADSEDVDATTVVAQSSRRPRCEVHPDFSILASNFDEALRVSGLSLFDRNRKVWTPNKSGKPDEVEKVAKLRLITSRYLDFGRPKTDRNGNETWRPESPPRPLLEAIKDAPDLFSGIKPLRRCVASPAILPSGEIVGPGYHEKSRLYNTGEIEATASMATVKAKQCFDFPFSDFPFESKADATNARAAAITIIAKELFSGPPPILLVAAPTEGSGKTLFVEALSLLTSNETPSTIEYSPNPEEFSKTIVSTMWNGADAILVDNVNHQLDHGKFCSIATSETTDTRLLGGNQMIKLRNESIWYVTANNPELTSELRRRTYLIRLNANCEDPEERSDFHIPNLKKWAKNPSSQTEFVSAGLSLIKAWIDAGSPRYRGRKLGSYSEWCEVVGGILEFHGYEDFLGNKDRLKVSADPETSMWREFLGEWWTNYQHRDVTASELYALATLYNPTKGNASYENHRDIPLVTLGSGPIRSQTTKLGSKIRKRLGQTFRVFSGGRELFVRLDAVEGKLNRSRYHLTPLPSGGREDLNELLDGEALF